MLLIGYKVVQYFIILSVLENENQSLVMFSQYSLYIFKFLLYFLKQAQNYYVTYYKFIKYEMHLQILSIW